MMRLELQSSAKDKRPLLNVSKAHRHPAGMVPNRDLRKSRKPSTPLSPQNCTLSAFRDSTIASRCTFAIFCRKSCPNVFCLSKKACIRSRSRSCLLLSEGTVLGRMSSLTDERPPDCWNPGGTDSGRRPSGLPSTPSCNGRPNSSTASGWSFFTFFPLFGEFIPRVAPSDEDRNILYFTSERRLATVCADYS